MDMNKHYLELTTFLNDASQDLDGFISGRMLPFGENTYIKRGKVFEKLISQSEHDGNTCTILSIVLPAIAKLAQNNFRDHLPGGTFENLSEQQIEVTKSVAI